jgi:hypothetical protein
MFLEESLVQQRNEMMEKFTHILQQLLLTVEESSMRNYFEGVTPFKVHANFDIPLFEA